MLVCGCSYHDNNISLKIFFAFFNQKFDDAVFVCPQAVAGNDQRLYRRIKNVNIIVFKAEFLDVRIVQAKYALIISLDDHGFQKFDFRAGVVRELSVFPQAFDVIANIFFQHFRSAQHPENR